MEKATIFVWIKDVDIEFNAHNVFLERRQLAACLNEQLFAMIGRLNFHLYTHLSATFSYHNINFHP